MTGLEYSRRARSDLKEIAVYTTLRWGVEQAEKYTDELETACKLLTITPFLGRPAESLRAGLRRLEQGSHVIFYTTIEKRITIRRILHKAMIASSQQL